VSAEAAAAQEAALAAARAAAAAAETAAAAARETEQTYFDEMQRGVAEASEVAAAAVRAAEAAGSKLQGELAGTQDTLEAELGLRREAEVRPCLCLIVFHGGQGLAGGLRVGDRGAFRRRGGTTRSSRCGGCARTHSRGSAPTSRRGCRCTPARAA
jgi:hypothetical protein